MRKFKKVGIKLIALTIAVIILISPLNVLGAVIAPKIDELLHKDEYIGASDAYLATADIQADNIDYYPESSDILDEDSYNDSSDNNSDDISAYAASVPGDPMVFYTQRWLNQEYGKVSGFGSVPENGKTGWDTVYGLLRALQHELGITSLSNNFGPSTSSKYSANPLSRKDGATDRKYAILQFALWCKGYSPGYNISYNQSTGKVTINAVFDANVEKAVIELKKDAGFTNPNGVVTLNVMKALMSMDSFKLLGSSYGAKSEVRAMQQEFNRKYESYIGLIPCDGVYSRSTNSALIYAYQAEEGLPVSVANGNFGPTTRKCAPNIPYTRSSGAALTYNGNYYSDSQISTFTKLLQFALFVNGFGNGSFNGNFDTATRQAVKDFQNFYKLGVTGTVDIGTWMSLFLSSGDPNRSALGADCAMILNEARAKTLYDNGYRYVGRYLTGTYGSNRISKALTIEEEQIILNARLRFFPIYQDGGTRLDYFTAEQGKSDGQTAVETAVALGIPKDTIIYFAVDFDALEYQVNSNVIPYFRAVYNELSQSIYRVGIYAPRYVCTLVANAGYSCSSFVGDMSTGFSGNLGYPIPDNWAFSQFANLEGNNALGSGDGRIEIDKDAVSGKDQGVDKLDLDYNTFQPPEFAFGNNEDVTLEGPTVNFLGKEFNLFKLDGGLSVLDEGLSIESCYDELEHEFRVLIDVKVNGDKQTLVGGRAKDKNKKNGKVDKFNSAYKDIKDIYYSFGKGFTPETSRRLNSYKGNFFDRSGKIGIECKSNIFGFVTYDTNTGNVKEGGICVIGSSTFSASYPFPPVPLTYLKLEVTGSFSMGLNLRVIDNKLFPYGELELIFDPRFGLEANALVANAYAGISGKINASLKFPSVPFENTFEANLTASVFFEYNAFIWGDKFEWEFKEWQLYPKKTKTNTAFSISRDDLKFIEPLPQVSAYSVSNEPNVFKNNMQIYCRPQIIDLDNGKMLMTYIDDSPNRSAENRTILMYSIFENDEWSVPKAVSDDKTADFEPSIYPDGNGGAHILWQNATKLFDNTVTLEEMSDNIDLQYIHFNGTSFDNSAAITTNNNDMEMMHRVVSNGDDISVVWVQNSENDTFGLTGKNSVFRKEYANGKWSDIKTVDSELQVISSIDTTYDGSKNIIAYTTKTGDDNSTADDLEVFYYNGNRVKQLTNDNFSDYSISLLGNELYWVNGNSLVQVTDGDINTKKVIVENMDVTATNIKALESSNDDKAVVWEQNIDDSATFYVANYNKNADTFNTPEPLSDNVGSVRGWDSCMLSDGQIEMAYGVVQEDNTISLMQRKMNQFCNISVNPIITYSGDIASDSDINILADIYNTGSLPVNQFDVNIYDNNKLLSSTSVSKDLPVGQSIQLEIPYTLPSNISRTDYTIEILPKGETDISLDDNKGTFSFGFADIAITDVKEIRTENGRQFEVTVKNQGFDSADNISINFCKDCEDGEAISSVSKTLLPNESTVVTFNIDNSYLDTSESIYARTFYISAQSDVSESDYGNNSEILSVYPDYSVNVTADKGGTVDGSGTFPYESTTTITAVPDEGYKFYAWYENGNILYNTPETYEIKVNSNRNLKALFVVDPEYPATVTGSIYQMTTIDGGKGGVAPGLTVTLGNEYTTTTASDGSFKFENVMSGVYIMSISGESTIDRTILVNVNNITTDVGDVTVACFDYVKDGVIDNQDKTAWQKWISTPSGTASSNVLADLNGDGYVNAKDFALLNRFMGKSKSDIYARLN